MLTDDAVRAQLVAEAREHVLRFDWGEVARHTQVVYPQAGACQPPAAGAGAPLAGPDRASSNP